jgi:DNA-directed RNA polymerase specialized sigma24 family protein
LPQDLQGLLDPLLHALDPDPEKAGIAYRQIQQRLIRFFRLNSAGDPESLADQALDRLARRIASQPGEVASPQAFALGIARHLLQEDTRRTQREARAAAEWTALASPHDPRRERLLQAIEDCMSRLRDDQRSLLNAYYQSTGREKIEHHQLALSLGLNLNALRNRLMRARAQLDKCVRARCGDVFPETATKP